MINRAHQRNFQDGLLRWRNGDGKAFDHLFGEAFPDMCKLAAWCLDRWADHRLDLHEPEALVNAIWETYRGQKNREIASKRHFVNRAGTLMRFFLNDQIKRLRTAKRDHGRLEVPFECLNMDC